MNLKMNLKKNLKKKKMKICVLLLIKELTVDIMELNSQNVKAKDVAGFLKMGINGVSTKRVNKLKKKIWGI